MAERAGKGIAVEYDARLVDRLRRKTFSNVKIIQDDILNIKLPGEKFVVVPHIPHAITMPILKKLLNNPSSGFQRGLLVMEKGAQTLHVQICEGQLRGPVAHPFSPAVYENHLRVPFLAAAPRGIRFAQN